MNITTNLIYKSLNIERNKFIYKSNGLTLINLDSCINRSLMFKRNYMLKRKSKNQLEEGDEKNNFNEEEITTEITLEDTTEITLEDTTEIITEDISLVNNDLLLSSSLNQNVIETAGDYKIWEEFLPWIKSHPYVFVGVVLSFVGGFIIVRNWDPLTDQFRKWSVDFLLGKGGLQPTIQTKVQVELNTSVTEPIIEKIDQSITAQNIILNEIQHPTGLIENVMGIINGVGSVAWVVCIGFYGYKAAIMVTMKKSFLSILKKFW